MTFQQRYIAMMQTHIERLEEGKARAERLTRRKDTLGESARRSFLALVTLDEDVDAISSDEVKARFDRLVDEARVIYKTKRQVIVTLGGVPCVVNRFGVATLTIPKSVFGDGWGTIESVPVFGDELLSSIGALRDGHDGRDPIYSYADCVVATDKEAA
jgi:hypothetical protein